jgi:hypothetical protein
MKTTVGLGPKKSFIAKPPNDLANVVDALAMFTRVWQAMVTKVEINKIKGKKTEKPKKKHKKILRARSREQTKLV